MNMKELNLVEALTAHGFKEQKSGNDTELRYVIQTTANHETRVVIYLDGSLELSSFNMHEVAYRVHFTTGTPNHVITQTAFAALAAL